MKRAALALFVLAVGFCGARARAAEGVSDKSMTIDGRPARVWTEEGTVKATVTAINHKTREITLKGPEGNSLSMEAGPEVKNFDQIKKGDSVFVDYLQSVALSVRKKGKDEKPKAESSVEVEAASKGEKPYAAAVHTTVITATVKAIDYKNRTVELVGPNGNSRTLKVPDEATRFNEVKKGDMIVAEVTNSLAISVEKSKK